MGVFLATVWQLEYYESYEQSHSLGIFIPVLSE